MTMQLQARMTSLEAQVREMREMLDDLFKMVEHQPTVDASVTAPDSPPRPAGVVAKPNGSNYGPRQMCPKCHVRPNYYLHVKYCKGNEA